MKKVVGVLSFLFLLCSPAAPQAQQTIRVNAGGSAYRDSKGQAWSADYGFNTGSLSHSAPVATITGSPDPTLFKSARVGVAAAPELQYQFPLVNGLYKVNLYFAETYYKKVGSRVFDVQVQGATVFSGLDIFAQAGPDHPLVKSAQVSVTQGRIIIRFVHRAGANVPIISAIEILPSGSAPPTAPSITVQPKSQTVSVGQAATFSVVAGGTAPLTFQWSKNGSSISGATAANYTAAAATSAENGSTFQVDISNSAGQLASAAAILTVSSSSLPTVTTTSLPGGQIGTGYSSSLTATGGTAPYTWSILSGSLPTGLSLSSGSISGTPTVANTSNFTVQVQDSKGQTATRALSIVIAAAPLPLQITTTSLPGGQIGTGYSSSLTATGGTAPYTWSILSGSLPTGLSLSSGSISGTPTATGTSSFTVQVSDSSSTQQTSTKALSINISGSATGTPLAACQTISSAGTYYLTQDVSSTGDCFPIAISGSVTINLNNHSLTYATGNNSGYARYGVVELSCSDPDLSNGTANGASCFNLNYSGTLTIYGPGSINNTVNSGQSSHGIRVGTINGSTNLVVHDVTFNLVQPTTSTSGAGEPIYSDYEDVTAYNNTFNDTGREIARCLGQTVINRQYFCGAVIQAQDSASVTAYNNTWNKAGDQNGIRAGGAGANIYNNPSGSINASWWNDFFYEVEGNNSTVHNNIIDCEASKGGNCRGIQVYNSTGSSVTNNTITVQEQAVSRDNVGDSPSCQLGGAYGIQLNGNPGYPTNTTVSGNSVTALGDQCGAYGFSSSDHGSGDVLSNNVWMAKRVGSSSTCGAGGGNQFIAAMRFDDKQYGATGTLLSTGDTLIGDCGSTMVWWDGANSWTCKKCTFSEGSNPDPANYHTFNFFNGGNATDPFYIIDATFTGGASKDSNNLSSAYQSASYLIQWTYTVTVEQSSNGSPATSATVTIKDALNNTECSGAVNASGLFSCVVTEERWYNSGGVHQEIHNPQTITISATGCTTDTHPLMVVSPTSETRSLTGSCN